MKEYFLNAEQFRPYLKNTYELHRCENYLKRILKNESIPLDQQIYFVVKYQEAKKNLEIIKKDFFNIIEMPNYKGKYSIDIAERKITLFNEGDKKC